MSLEGTKHVKANRERQVDFGTLPSSPPPGPPGEFGPSLQLEAGGAHGDKSVEGPLRRGPLRAFNA